MTGGASLGRGRGIATVFVERTEVPADPEEFVGARFPRTGEVRVPRTGEVRVPQTGEIRVPKKKKEKS